MPRWFVVPNAVVKGVAILVGLFGTMVSAMSAVGAVAENGWARFVVAAVVSVGVPTLIWQRLARGAPRDESGAALATETFALTLLGIAFVYVVALHFATTRLLAREADREYAAGAYGVAQLVYVLAGVTPVPDSVPAARAR